MLILNKTINDCAVSVFFLPLFITEMHKFTVFVYFLRGFIKAMNECAALHPDTDDSEAEVNLIMMPQVPQAILP